MGLPHVSKDNHGSAYSQMELPCKNNARRSLTLEKIRQLFNWKELTAAWRALNDFLGWIPRSLIGPTRQWWLISEDRGYKKSLSAVSSRSNVFFWVEQNLGSLSCNPFEGSPQSKSRFFFLRYQLQGANWFLFPKVFTFCKGPVWLAEQYRDGFIFFNPEIMQWVAMPSSIPGTSIYAKRFPPPFRFMQRIGNSARRI